MEPFPSAPIRLRHADELVTPLLRLFDQHARSFGFEFFLAGELAEQLSSQRPPSELWGTMEIEFRIAVEDGGQLDSFQNALISTNEFVPAEGKSRRLFYVDGSLYEDSNGNLGWVLQVDLIPFRGSPDAGRVVKPQASPDDFVNLSCIEALRSSFSVEVEEGLVMRVASMAGLALMDLTAAVCLGQAAGVAGGNLGRFLTEYRSEAKDRMFELESDLIQELDYDEVLIDCVFDGRDTADICGKQLLDQLRSALTSSDNRGRFASDVARAYVESRIRSTNYIQWTEAWIDRETKRMEPMAEAFCIGFVGRWGNHSRIVRYSPKEA